MSEHGHAPGRTRRSPHKGRGVSDAAKSAQPTRNPLSAYPIRLTDVVLFDLRVERIPQNTPWEGNVAGSLHLELLRPLVLENRLEVAVKVHVSAPSVEAPAYQVEATLNGVFELGDGVDDALVTTFTESTALYLIWPYARELFQSVSMRMRVPPIILPTLDTQPATRASAGPRASSARDDSAELEADSTDMPPPERGR